MDGDGGNEGTRGIVIVGGWMERDDLMHEGDVML